MPKIMYRSTLLRNSLLLLLLLAVIGCAWFALRSYLRQVGYMPIEVVAFTENLRFEDPDLIRNTVSPLVAQGFFACDLNSVQSNLEKLPWIAKADVQRKWPNRLQISLTERTPLAIWQDQGVIDAEGVLFFPVSLANVNGLARFSGEREHISDMVSVYSLLMTKLQPLGLAVRDLAITADSGWQAGLDNGITLMLGSNELAERLHRFVLAYTVELSSEVDHIRVVDLRYTNGLAVG